MLYCTILQALALLEKIIWADPTTNLQEGLLFNLCTIYELESSYSLQKKQKLLEFVSKHRGDGFNISCLKIPWCSRYLLADFFKNKTRTWLKEKEIRQYTRVDKRHGEWYCVLRIFNRLRAFSHFSSSGIVVLVTCEKWARLEKRGRLPLPSRSPVARVAIFFSTTFRSIEGLTKMKHCSLFKFYLKQDCHGSPTRRNKLTKLWQTSLLSH